MSLLDHLPSWPSADFSEFGAVEIRPIGRIQQLTGSLLGRNWVAIPHVTHHDEADITDMELRRKTRAHESTSKVTAVVLLIRAMVDALREFPQFNASLSADGKELALKKYFNVGVAVDTPRGLLVPVLRDCDRKTLDEVASELSTLSAKARDKGLSLREMSGGCITISSLGHIGGAAFTPIINAPELAILGVSRARVVATPGNDGAIAWRTMLPLSLSYDHRVINGADAARFVRFIAERLALPELFS